MFFWSHIAGSTFLVMEAFLAWLAFSGYANKCITDDGENGDFPCAVAGLYNYNMLEIPFIGQVCNFYPLLNIAAVPILNITLRNNLLDVLPIKRWIKSSGMCLFLLEDHRNVVKGVWSMILSLPVFCVVFFYKNVQDMVTYTGGFCGAFILLYFPAALIINARRCNAEQKMGCENPNKSPFQHRLWPWLVVLWATICIASVIIKIATGESGE